MFEASQRREEIESLAYSQRAQRQPGHHSVFIHLRYEGRRTWRGSNGSPRLERRGQLCWQHLENIQRDHASLPLPSDDIKDNQVRPLDAKKDHVWTLELTLP